MAAGNVRIGVFSTREGGFLVDKAVGMCKILYST